MSQFLLGSAPLPFSAQAQSQQSHELSNLAANGNGNGPTRGDFLNEVCCWVSNNAELGLNAVRLDFWLARVDRPS